MTLVGNGSGHGFHATGGATGNGIHGTGGSSTGDGIVGTGTGSSGCGMKLARGGTSGDDLTLVNSDATLLTSIDARLPSALGANGNIKADIRDFNGTAGTFASGRPEVNATHLAGSAIQQTGGYIKAIEVAKGKTWYLAASGGNDSNSGLLPSAPLATFAQALSNASPGDTIFAQAGTYTGQFTINKNRITLIGEGDTTIFTESVSGATLTVTGTQCRIAHLKITSPNLSAGNPSHCLKVDGAHGLIVEYVTLDGQDDGIYANISACNDLLVRFVTSTATQSPIAIWNSKNLRVEDSTFTHSLTKNGDYVNIGSHSAALNFGTEATYSRCRFYCFPNSDNLGGDTGAVSVNGTTALIDPTHVSFVDCQIALIYFGTNTSNHKLCGIIQDTTVTAAPCHVSLERTSIYRYTPSVAGSLDIDISQGNSVGSTCKAINCSVDKTKTDGDGVTIIDGQIGDTYTAANSVDGKIPEAIPFTNNKVDANASVTLTQDDIDNIADGVAAGIGTVSAFNVDADHTWTFNNSVQPTAPKIIKEVIGFNGLLAMDLTKVMPQQVSISSVDSATFANISGTEPTVSASAVSANKKQAQITINAATATANTYTLTVTITTTDSQTFVRSGQIMLS
jgi:hypothetical protein